MGWTSSLKITMLVLRRRERETPMSQIMKAASRSPPKLPSKRWLLQVFSSLVPHFLLDSSSDQTPLLVSSLVPSFPVSKLLSPNLTPVVLGITPRKKLRLTDPLSERLLKKPVSTLLPSRWSTTNSSPTDSLESSPITASTSRTPLNKDSIKRDSNNFTKTGWRETSNLESNTSLLLSVIPSVIHSRIPPVQLSTFSSSFPPLLPSFSVTILLTTISSETSQHQSDMLRNSSLTATALVRTQTASTSTTASN